MKPPPKQTVRFTVDVNVHQGSRLTDDNIRWLADELRRAASGFYLGITVDIDHHTINPDLPPPPPRQPDPQLKGYLERANRSRPGDAA